ncbi:MAG: anthranilate synthase component I family protein [Bacteroidales bacterium]|jgi:para-aminobenzoate synthetase component 1|nr:anthranilate synthase component I family protein [Bacteroidales bacterium]
MRVQYKIAIDNASLFKQKLHFFALNFNHFLILNSNNYPARFEYLAALDVVSVFKPEKEYFNELFQWHKHIKDWAFGHLSYDLKNHIEKLTSSHPDSIQFPLLFFFQPKYIIQIEKNQITYLYLTSSTENEVINLHQQIQRTKIETEFSISPFKKRMEKHEYVQHVNNIKKHIQLGDVYEVNFCQEFYNTSFHANPSTCFNQLQLKSPMPFSAYYRLKEKFLLSASPERYLQKINQRIISQPIKGTIKRTNHEQENVELKKQLRQNKKDVAENIMIVDLVRNDLSLTALKNSVKVKELCGIYEFPTIFQMISTIESRIDKELPFTEVIKTTFPMGSMTGAPKIKAMELIEKYETIKRGLYSGSVGYITPNGDFDFNVVIRSLQINSNHNYASFITGGAITILSNTEQEYEECFVKAQGLLKSLQTTIE